MTQTQLAMYFEAASHPEEPLYIIPLMLTLDDSTDLERLCDAVNKMVTLHPILSTCIIDSERLSPLPDGSVRCDIEEMSDEQYSELKATLPHTFNLDGGKLFEARIFKTPSAKYLYMQVHHAICDGGSLLIIDRDITDLYNGVIPSHEIKTYSDIIRDEESRRTINSPSGCEATFSSSSASESCSEEYKQARNWYLDTFLGIDTDSMLLPDVLVAKESQIERKKTILKTPYEKAFAASRSLNVPLSILLNASFAYTVANFGATESALFYTIYNGRKTEDVKNTVTMMVKTLPVYASWNTNTTLSDMLITLKEQQQKAKDNDIFSYAEVCAETGIAPALSFSYRGSINSDKYYIAGHCTHTERLGKYTGGQLSFILDHNDGGFVLNTEYNAANYSDSYIASFITAFDNVLSQMCSADASSKVEDICISTDECIAHITELGKGQKVDYDSNKTFVDLFREQAKRTPDNIAVVSGDVNLTYRELDELSDAIALYLNAHGIGKEDAVSIIIPRTEMMPVCSIGVMKAGATYQPLDPSYPEERLNFMMKDADAKFLIANRELRRLVSEYEGEILFTDEIANLTTSQDANYSSFAPSTSDRYILLYTSGSTGVPKGCQLLHSNLVSFLVAAQQILNYNEKSHVTAYASYGFDANMFDMYPVLVHGGELHIIGEDIRFDLDALNKYFEAKGITHAFMTTQVARAYATSIEAPSSLRYLTCGGEALVPLEKPSSYKMLNGYGPTECTIFATTKIVDQLYSRIPIGRANANLQLYVVDKKLRQLPLGALGELVIAGPQVARGYLNRPEKTTEVFIELNGEKAYRTGDVVRMLPNGEIDFIGRQDGQVKIRGFRIELTEVEQIIREFDGIKDATVQAFDDPAGGKFIAAYIVADNEINIDKLNSFIAETKPPYMVPAVTMQIDEIPLNQNQKVNKKALPKPQKPKVEIEGESTHVNNILEDKIIEAISTVLKTTDIPVSMPLSYLGLTSISSIRLAAALYKEFGVNLKGAELIKEGTVLSIENAILAMMMSKASKTEEESIVKTVTKSASLTISQQGVYADVMREPNSITYNIPFSFTFPLSVTATRLQEAVTKVLNAHSFLRDIHISMGENDVEQTIEQTSSIDIDIIEMSEAEYDRYKMEFVRPIDIFKAPLYNICVVQTESALHLLVSIHHIAFDGASTSILLRHIVDYLEGVKIDEEKFSYLNYATEEQEYIGSDEYNKAGEFYRQILIDCEASSDIQNDKKDEVGYPLARRTQVSQSAGNLQLNECRRDNLQLAELMRGNSCKTTAVLDFDVIEKFCNKMNITPASLCMAATGYAIARFTNSRNSYFSTISSGRSDVRYGETFGMFVKTLPVGVVIEDITAGEFALKTHSILNGIIHFEKYPYAKICKDYNFSPTIAYEYQLGVLDDIKVGGESVIINSLGADTLKWKVSVNIELVEGQPSVVVKYRDGFYTENLMHRLAEGIANVAKQIATTPNISARKLSLLTNEEKDKVEKHHTTATAEVPFKRFYEPIEKNAIDYPERIALIAKDRTLTFKEFNAEANRIANALIARGVKRGDRVVLLLPRTSAVLVSMFGVSKTGAAYIPCDPAYPAERVTLITTDSEAQFIITTEDRLAEYPEDKVINIDELYNNAEYSTENPNIDVQPDDLAYLIYTSGSTGRPKGVMLRHAGITNYLYNHPANIHISGLMRLGVKTYVSITTLSFDMSLKEFAGSLFNGITVVLADEKEILDPVLLAELMKRTGAEVINGTCSRIASYLEVPEFCEVLKTQVKMVWSGGEMYPQSLLEKLQSFGVEIINTYGPTEITVSSNIANLTHAQSVTVGRPLLNYVEWIVDKDNNELPIGVPGELLIGGAGVARGYNNLPEQTAERFVEYNGVRVYRSGDLARWTEDGEVVIMGRIDSQVKVRGFRVELDEIETQVAHITGISQAVVDVKKIAGTDHLVLYYTTKPDFINISASTIKTALEATSLTEYMIPDVYMQLDAIPLTPNGKANRKALPIPELEARKAGRLPQSEDERFFCEAFAKALDVDTVYADDNFFEIGGSSLLVTRVLITATKAGKKITYSQVFDNPTPQKLAALIGGEASSVNEVNASEASSVNEANAGEATFSSPNVGEAKNNGLEADFNFKNYDYSSINALLAKNTLDSFRNGERLALGDVLLCGATGFAGIHVLHELLHRYEGIIYCPVRGNDDFKPDERLASLFFYYFGEDLTTSYSSRLCIYNGDITKPETLMPNGCHCKTVINCAANVKHFSAGTDIEDINYYAVLNLIEFCKKTGASLIQTSTHSVQGFVPKESDKVMTEKDCFFGQEFEGNKYCISKFAAERAVLEATAKGEIIGKVIRLGNLAPRDTDGEFQINFKSNGFMNRLKTITLVGCYPYAMYNEWRDISPIDLVAQAIVLFAQTPKECVQFHGENLNRINMGNMYAYIDNLGYNVKPVEAEQFTTAFEVAKNDPAKIQAITGMLAYEGKNANLRATGYSNNYSAQVLLRMGFRWPVISQVYIDKFLRGLSELGYFDL